MRVRANLLIMSGVTLVLAACTVRSADDARLKELTNASSSEVANATATEQISPDGKADPVELLHVEQVSTDSGPPDYTFPYVEGDDPCAHLVNRELPECDPAFIGRQTNLEAMENNDRSTALSDLQAITPNIIDPLEFDPDRTIDELGRTGRRLQPLAGQAVGAEFLAPPPPEPEPEELETNPRSGRNTPPPGNIDGLHGN